MSMSGLVHVSHRSSSSLYPELFVKGSVICVTFPPDYFYAEKGYVISEFKALDSRDGHG